MSETIYTTQVPAGSFNDNVGYTMGTAFTSSVDGVVPGVRMWVGATAPAGAIGLLYSGPSEAGGVELARVTYGPVSPNGWATALFATPVAITAGVTYVAAYWTPGPYVASATGLFAAPVVSGHLTGIQSGSPIANGRFSAGSTPTYPTGGGATKGYFADVLFDVAVTPPTVVTGTDGAVMPMLQKMLDLYKLEAAKVAAPVKYASIRPGIAYVAGFSTTDQGVTIADEASEGSIWLRIVNFYPSNNFPTQDTGYENMPPGSLAVVVEMGIARAIPYQGENDTTMPTSQQHIDATAMILADVAAMRRTYLRLLDNRYDAILGQYQPIPSEANTGGGTMHVTVRVPFCDQ